MFLDLESATILADGESIEVRIHNFFMDVKHGVYCVAIGGFPIKMGDLHYEWVGLPIDEQTIKEKKY